MLDENDLKAIAQLIDTKLQAQQEDIQDILKQQSETLVEMMEDKIRGVKVLIENDIGKRIDSLYDGYKLVHEKQWELEKEFEKLKVRLEQLEARAG